MTDFVVFDSVTTRRPFVPYVKEAWRRRDFAIELSRTQVRAQHVDTLVGQMWTFVTPILLGGVYLFLVDVLRKGHHPPGIFAHLLAAIFAYQMFSESAREGVRSIVNGNQLILNSAFPTVLLPVSCVLTAFRRFWPALFIYVPAHVLAGRPVGTQLLWVIPLVVLLLVLSAGVAILMASLQVFYRDIRELLPFVLRLMMFVSPILFLPAEVMNRFSWVLDVTPVGQLLTAWTDVLYFGRPPGLHSMLIACAWAFGSLGLGLWVCTAREQEFATRL